MALAKMNAYCGVFQVNQAILDTDNGIRVTFV